MSIRQLSLTDFRNLKSATLDFDRCINFVCGGNGSGKTSLLEAIYVLCQARSFRTHQLNQCIRHDKSGFLLFGRFGGFKAGLARQQDKTEIRIDGEVIRRRSELVRRSPIQVVNADSFVLIEGSPARRRAFLDWCLFHVEHDYAENWRRYQHALKQRNRLLKNKRDLHLLGYWDRHLLEPSERLQEERQRYAARLQQLMRNHFAELLHDVALEITYRSGWPRGQGLRESLEKSRERDIRQGFTSYGIHRDDLQMATDGRPIGEVLSRGQSKRVCLALLLAALELVEERSQDRVILLIDDLNSELDDDAQRLVYRQLLAMDLQLFITNIDSRLPTALEAKEYKMFHVEHGTIKPRIFS